MCAKRMGKTISGGPLCVARKKLVTSRVIIPCAQLTFVAPPDWPRTAPGLPGAAPFSSTYRSAPMRNCRMTSCIRGFAFVVYMFV